MSQEELSLGVESAGKMVRQTIGNGVGWAQCFKALLGAEGHRLTKNEAVWIKIIHQNKEEFEPSVAVYHTQSSD